MVFSLNNFIDINQIKKAQSELKEIKKKDVYHDSVLKMIKALDKSRQVVGKAYDDIIKVIYGSIPFL